ncbi:MAG: class I SAM-dependent methyltransferase [Rhodospirillaceae bacterium]|jgi:predicted O-methyltransferase YrrM
MALDKRLFDAAEELYTPGMGTEHVAPMLYSLVRMTRPRRVLEVGLGYTSPFLAQALHDNLAEIRHDKKILSGKDENSKRKAVLVPDYYEKDYDPSLIAIDDMSLKGSTAPKVQDILKRLELDTLVDVHNGDFRGYSDKFELDQLPLDFVWFDCGGADEYIQFLEEYWPLINCEHGILVLHFTYWYADLSEEEGTHEFEHFLAPIANDIKRQQMAAGHDAEFEVLSLLEPHKSRQGSVTMVRKLNEFSMSRDEDFQDAMNNLTDWQAPPMPKL